jgi:zinc transport system ATP-binding protein
MIENGHATTASIELSNLSASYGARNILEHVSLTIPPRDFLGIVGPNGGGKTTLLRVILGMLKPTEGRVIYRLGDAPVNHIDFGYLPQYNRVDSHFPALVSDVVLSGLRRPRFWPSTYSREQKEQARSVMAEMGLEALAQQPVGMLSGGQMQRVLLARAVVGRPDVLVLDEPNTYVSAEFQTEMYGILSSLNASTTILVVTHDEGQLLPVAKRILTVNRGISGLRILREG